MAIDESEGMTGRNIKNSIKAPLLLVIAIAKWLRKEYKG